jgi:hypothetical protein
LIFDTTGRSSVYQTAYEKVGIYKRDLFQTAGLAQRAFPTKDRSQMPSQAGSTFFRYCFMAVPRGKLPDPHMTVSNDLGLFKCSTTLLSSPPNASATATPAALNSNL